MVRLDSGEEKLMSLPDVIGLPREERGLETDRLTPLCSSFSRTCVWALHFFCWSPIQSQRAGVLVDLGGVEAALGGTFKRDSFVPPACVP